MKKSLDAFTTIFDEAYHKVLPSISTSTTWKIAGAVSLPHWRRSVKSRHAGLVSEPDIIELSQILGFSVQNIVELLDGNRHVFDVIASKYGQQDLIVSIKPEVKEFLLDEARSGDFYFAYRSGTTLEFLSKILHHMGSEGYVVVSLLAL